MKSLFKSIVTGVTIACLAVSVDGGLTSCAYAAGVKTNLSTPQAKAALSAAAKVIGTDAVAALSQAALAEITTGKLNIQSAAGTELFGLANDLLSSGAVGTLVSAFALPKTAAVAASIADTPNGNSLPSVINAIATVVSTATNAPPANPTASIDAKPAA